MGQVANNFGEFSLAGLNDSTGWLCLDQTVEDVAFNITGTFNATITMQVSNQFDYVKTRFSNVTTYTAVQAPLAIPREIGRYVRFIVTVWASGIAYVGISKGISPSGQLFDIQPQTNEANPSSQFS